MSYISVIIPAYNAEKTISAAIQSVLNQTFSDFELIVINDGSKDATLDIASNITDHRLKVFSYPNSGASVSRNRGFSHSSGEFIAFLDADDLWKPEKLEAQLSALQTNPQADVAYSWTDFIDELGHPLKQGCHITENGNVYAKLLLTCFVVSGSNPLIRRPAFEAVGCFDESLLASQDFDLYLRLAARYSFVAVASPQVLYRISNNSMSTNIRRLEVTSLQARRKAFKQAPEPLPLNLKRHSIANFYKSLLFRLLDRPPSRGTGLNAAWFFGNAIAYDPLLLSKRVSAKVLFKILVFLALPTHQAKALMTRFKGLFNINALLGYIKVDLPELK